VGANSASICAFTRGCVNHPPDHLRQGDGAVSDSKQLQDGEMFARLRHDAIVGGDPSSA